MSVTPIVICFDSKSHFFAIAKTDLMKSMSSVGARWYRKENMQLCVADEGCHRLTAVVVYRNQDLQ